MSQKYASAIPKASKTHYLQVNTNIPNTRQPPKKKKRVARSKAIKNTDANNKIHSLSMNKPYQKMELWPRK